MEHKDLFTGKANVYTQARPSYPSALIDDLCKSHGFNPQSVVADIGSGTGKFAKLLLQKGCKVFCVEPNLEMRTTAEAELHTYSYFVSVDADASNTTLADGSVDFVTAAQAFHWFDTLLFKNECKRIAKPNAKAVLVWNNRTENSPLHIQSKQIFETFCPRFKGFSGGVQDITQRIDFFFDGCYETVSYPNPVFCNEEQFIKRCLSSSYALNPADANYDAMIKALHTLFADLAKENTVQMDYTTVAYIGNI